MSSPSVPPDEGEGISLGERLPEYAVLFTLGLFASLVVGAAIAVIRDGVTVPDSVTGFAGLPSYVVGLLFALAASAPAVVAVAYTMLGLGVVLMLTGGATGGGYTNIGVGAIGALFGGRSRPDDDFDDADVRRGKRAVVDPMERLRKGLRPAANPRAFWQVAAGLAYVALALVLLVNLT